MLPDLMLRGRRDVWKCTMRESGDSGDCQHSRGSLTSVVRLPGVPPHQENHINWNGPHFNLEGSTKVCPLEKKWFIWAKRGGGLLIVRVYTTGGILEYLLLDTLITVTGGDYQMKTTLRTSGRDDQVDLVMSRYWCCGFVLKLLLGFTT